MKNLNFITNNDEFDNFNSKFSNNFEKSTRRNKQPKVSKKNVRQEMKNRIDREFKKY